jgi:hypothetical protein
MDPDACYALLAESFRRELVQTHRVLSDLFAKVPCNLLIAQCTMR